MICALCNETQIDINTANLTELEKIIHIGPKIAPKIIENRTFNSVNDLARVKGIGNATYLADIKLEGLACVSEEVQNTENNSGDNTEIINNQTENSEQTYDNSTTETESRNSSSQVSITSNTVNDIPKSKIETMNLTLISLNSKSIKSENNKEVLKKNLALGGIVTFCAGFGTLFLLKQARRKKENEFR